MTAGGLALVALIGLSLGVLGGGGSILAVPVFVYVLGYDAKEAVAMSLAVVGATSLFGAVGHWRAGNVNVRIALLFGSVAMVGTYFGARLAVLFSGSAQLALFAVVMLAAAFFMLRDKQPSTPRAGIHVLAPGLHFPLVAFEGMVVGVLTGLVGVGGGFLIVPALALLCGLPMKTAVGTSLMVIALKSFAGFAGYLGQVEVRWDFVAIFAAVAMIGSLAGSYLSRCLAEGTLRRAFALLLLVTGMFILYENLGAFV